MAHSVVRVEGEVKIEPTRELEAMLRRVMLDVIRSQQHTETIPAVRPEETAVLTLPDNSAALKLAEIQSELRAIAQAVARHQVVPGSWLFHLQERLMRLAR